MADNDGSVTDTETVTEETTTEAEETLTPEEELAKWKSMARKHEANAKKNEQAAAKLQKIEDANKTELQKLQDKAAQAEARAAALELRDLQRSVAEAKKLPAYMAGRLQGSNQAELEADADEILKQINGGKKPADLKQGANGKVTKPAENMSDWVRGLRR